MSLASMKKFAAVAFVSVFAAATLFACGNDDAYDSDYDDDREMSALEYESDEYRDDDGDRDFDDAYDRDDQDRDYDDAYDRDDRDPDYDDDGYDN